MTGADNNGPTIGLAKGVELTEAELELTIARECQVIGSVFLNADSWSAVSDLAPEDFCVAEYRQAWRSIRGFAMAGEAHKLTPLAVAQAAKVDSRLLLRCVAQVVTSANAADFARDMRASRALREAMSAARQAQLETDPAKMGAALQRASKIIFDIREFNEQTAPSLSDRFLDHFSAMARGEIPPAPSTGIPDLDQRLGGLVPGDLQVWAGRPGMGKAQPLTAKVRTLDGWKLMGDLQIGDRLMSVDGAASEVTGIYPQGRKPIYRVVLSDGRSTEACGDHLWEVRYRDWPAARIVSTTKLREMLTRARYQKRLIVRTVHGEAGADADLPMSPYALGAWLGNGGRSAATVRISFGDEETAERFAWEMPDEHQLRWVENYDHVVTYCRRGNKMLDALRGLGVAELGSHERFIPEAYKGASRAQRMALIQGLMDTDGWAEKRGSAMYSTSSKRLSDDFCEVARSLGYICFTKRRTAAVTNPDGTRDQKRDAFVTCITGQNCADLFRLERKRERCAGRVWSRALTVESVEPAGEAECQCIMVSHPSHLYVTDGYILTHNTVATMSIFRQSTKLGAFCGYFSFEIGERQFGPRLVADEAYRGYGNDVYFSSLMRGQVPDSADRDLVGEAAYRLRQLDFRVSFTAGMTTADIETTVKRWEDQAGKHMDAVFVDYSAFVRDSGQYRGQAAKQVGEIFLDFKQMARRRNTCAVVVHQLNRGVEQRDDKRPTMADLRDSGEVEQHADSVNLLFREEYYLDKLSEIGLTEEQKMDLFHRKEAVRGKVEIISDKNRSGQSGTIRCNISVGHNALRQAPPGTNE